MADILEKIVAHKRTEVAQRQARVPVAVLEEGLYFNSPTVSLVKYLQRPDKSGIIAEFKRRSPSKGDINPHAQVEQVTIGYMQAGATALSVLTDEHFFGGRNADLTEARKYNYCPILRKDFVIDEYQILEARAIGADIILLIAECLTAAEVKHLAAFARSLGLEVLLEVHSADQLAKLTPSVNVVGVNNRNLKTFTVSIQTSLELSREIPADFLRISESGISDPKALVTLREAGYQGFLIGEYFMQDAEPHRRAKAFIEQLRDLTTTPKINA